LEKAQPYAKVHECAVDGVEQRHAGGEQHRQAKDCVEQKTPDYRTRGHEEQRHLGLRPEPEPQHQTFETTKITSTPAGGANFATAVAPPEK